METVASCRRHHHEGTPGKVNVCLLNTTLSRSSVFVYILSHLQLLIPPSDSLDTPLPLVVDEEKCTVVGSPPKVNLKSRFNALQSLP